MRILHVVPSYIPAYRYGGPIYSVHGLCKGLGNLGHDVHVFTTNVDGPFDSDVPLGSPVEVDSVKIWYFTSKHLRRFYWSPTMAKALKSEVEKFDLLHLHSMFLWPIWASASSARKFQIPYVYAPRGMLNKDLVRRKSSLAKTAWIRLIDRRNLEKAAAIHVTSNLEAKEIERFGFNLPRIVTVPNGVSFEVEDESKSEISPKIFRLIKKKPFLLFISRINWKKGLDRLIPALSEVPNIYSIIAGNDEENYQPVLEQLVKKHGVSERITFTGPVYGADKVTLIKNAALFVLPSYSENFGNAVLEAMAGGCPVLITPEVGVSDIVQETGSGIVVKGQPEEIAKNLRNILANPELLKDMGKRGRQAVAENFTWDIVTRKMELVYKSILKKHLH